MPTDSKRTSWQKSIAVLKILGLACAAAVALGLCVTCTAPTLFLQVPLVGWRLWSVSGQPLPPWSAQEQSWGPSPYQTDVFPTWLRENDVLLSSCTRCGGHLLRHILHLLRSNGTAMEEDLDKVVPYLGFRSFAGENWQHHLEEHRHHWDNRSFSFRVMKAYPPLAALGAQTQDITTLDMDSTLVRRFPKVRFIVLARSGPDMICSLRSYWSKHDSLCRASWGGFPPHNMSHLELIELLDQNPHLYWDWFNAWWRLRHDSNVLLLNYADFVHDKTTQLRRMISFLNLTISDETLKLVENRTSFENMKKAARSLGGDMLTNTDGWQDTTFGHGTTGRAAAEFSHAEWHAWHQSEQRHINSPYTRSWLHAGALSQTLEHEGGDETKVMRLVPESLSLFGTFRRSPLPETPGRGQLVRVQENPGILLVRKINLQAEEASRVDVGWLDHSWQLKFEYIRNVLLTASASWQTSVLVGVIYVVSATSSATIGFGGGVCFQALWCIAGMCGLCRGDVVTATVVLLVTNYFCDCMMSVILRQHTSWPCLSWSLPSVLVGHAFGIGLLVVISNISRYEVPFTLTVSLILLLVAALQMPFVTSIIRHKKMQSQDPGKGIRQSLPEGQGPGEDTQLQPKQGVFWSTSPPSFATALVFCRFLQGFFSGCTGMGGWPPMLFVLRFNPAKDEFRATQSTLLTAQALMTIPVLIVLGILAPFAQWRLLICSVAGQALGAAIGVRIRVDQDTWRAVMVLVVATTALLSGGKALHSVGKEL